MKIELLVNAKTYPMILTSIQVIKANTLTNEVVPTLSREESIRLDADVGDILGFHDMFSDAVTYCYVEGGMTNGAFGDDINTIDYQILVDGKPADYVSLAAVLA